MAVSDSDRDEYEPETWADRDPVGAWRFEVDWAIQRGDVERAERLQAGGPPPGLGPSDFVFSPGILAVEVGADPGGALAVAACALDFDQFRLVITMGHPETARFTRHLLDLVGRRDVSVVASAAPAPQNLSIAGLVPTDVQPQSADVLGAVRAIVDSYRYVIRWGNCGALTDLAAVYAADRALADQLLCYVAAGPLDAAYVNFESDPTSAVAAIGTLHRPPRTMQDPRVDGGSPEWPHLLTEPFDDHTLGPESETQRLLAEPTAPAWAHLLAAHFSQWFGQGNPTASLYPVLTVAELDGVAFLDYDRRHVTVDDTGRVHLGDSGTEMWTTLDLGGTITYWLHNALGLTSQPQ